MGLGISNNPLTQVAAFEPPKETRGAGFAKTFETATGRRSSLASKAQIAVRMLGAQLKNKQLNQSAEQVEELSKTLQEMKNAAPQLKTRADVKAAIKLSKALANQGTLIDKGFDLMLKKANVSQKVQIIALKKKSQAAFAENNQLLSSLKQIKIEKHVKPEKAKSDVFLSVYPKIRAIPVVGAVLKRLAGLFSNVDDKIKLKLQSQYEAAVKSIQKIEEVSKSLTEVEQVSDLLNRASEAHNRLLALNRSIENLLRVAPKSRQAEIEALRAQAAEETQKIEELVVSLFVTATKMDIEKQISKVIELSEKQQVNRNSKKLTAEIESDFYAVKHLSIAIRAFQEISPYLSKVERSNLQTKLTLSYEGIRKAWGDGDDYGTIATTYYG